MIAACALIISINLHQKNMGVKSNFFIGCQINFGLIEMNLEIWNNKRVFYLTGYHIEDIKQCLYDLSMLLKNNNLSEILS